MLRSKAWSGHSSLRPPPSRDGAGRSAFTFGAVLPTAFFTGQLASVVDEEAGHAREFVGLGRHDAYEQFLVGEVRAGQFKGFGEVCLVQVNDCAACGAGFFRFSAPREAPWPRRPASPAAHRNRWTRLMLLHLVMGKSSLTKFQPQGQGPYSPWMKR